MLLGNRRSWAIWSVPGPERTGSVVTLLIGAATSWPGPPVRRRQQAAEIVNNQLGCSASPPAASRRFGPSFGGIGRCSSPRRRRRAGDDGVLIEGISVAQAASSPMRRRGGRRSRPNALAPYLAPQRRSM